MKVRNLLWMLAMVVLSCGMLFSSAVSIRAQEKYFLELDYARVNLENTTNCEAYFKGIEAKFEATVYRAIRAGVDYTYGDGGTIKMFGFLYGGGTFQDCEFYAKVPMNLTSITSAMANGGNIPQINPFYVSLLFKTNVLKTNDVSGEINWENSSGGGLGLGFDSLAYKKLRLYGQFEWFPEMQSRSSFVPNKKKGETYFYKIWNYGLGIRADISRNIYCNLSYKLENREYLNTVEHYSTLSIGAGLKF
ncbi:MAG: hypothetical protein V2A78_10745 [bacterium]